jgi:sugar lactone lactonase YvrE
MMKPLGRVAAAFCFIALSSAAVAWDRGNVETFATLPAGTVMPEGIAVGPRGDLFVTTFAVTAPDTDRGKIVVFNKGGHVRDVLEVAGSSKLLLGIAFHPQTHELLVIDFGASKVWRVNPANGNSSVFTTVTGSAGLNALAFDTAGNVYVSDSSQGIVWRTGPSGAPVATPWAQDPLLQTSGTPPFGANGMDFDSHGRLYVANTGDDRVIRIPVDAAGKAGTAEVFVNSVNGADGLLVDERDNIWVCANQADEIVVIDPSGKAIAKLGDFNGIDASGRPSGLLFPASLVRVGDWIYVTNLSLDIRLFRLPQAVDSQYAAQVTSHTVSRIRVR